MIVKLALRDANRSFDKLYSYIWPDALGMPLPGMWVKVPFGKGSRMQEAFVMAVVADDTESDEQLGMLKTVDSLLQPEPIFNSAQLNLAEQMKILYLTSYGDCLRLMLPPGFPLVEKRRSILQKFYRISNAAECRSLIDNNALRSEKQVRCLEYLLQHAEAELNELCRDVAVTAHVPNGLLKRGLLTLELRECENTGPEFSKEPLPESAGQSAVVLNSAQQTVVDTVRSALFKEREPRSIKEYLLHGVTGSGKTEVYLHIAQKVLDAGASCLLLVPEIALTPQMQERCVERFGNLVALMHSRLTRRARHEIWAAVRSGEVRFLLGARSAIFAPLKELSLIIIDEEHESGYKSESNPRYDARTVARLRARDEGSVLLLASATPSIETYHRAVSGRSEILRLQERAGSAGKPQLEIVDMKREISGGNNSVFSLSLVNALAQCFEAGEQAILFLNRRGHSNLMLCRDCGYHQECPQCSVPLTYHRDKKGRAAFLMCHHCDRIFSLPQSCPTCASSSYAPFGLGTQQIEDEFLRIFPERKILRMDKDTTSSGTAHKDILKAFSQSEADVLLGTQMIAKGHDIPNVTLVGILAADQLFAIPHYKAAERAFQLIAQAAGRSGRAEKVGQVIVQCFDVENPYIRWGAGEDYASFISSELALRQNLVLPPFTYMVEIYVQATTERKLAEASEQVFTLLHGIVGEEGRFATSIFPAIQAYPYTVNSKFRNIILLKSANQEYLHYLLARALELQLPSEVVLQLHLDPA